MHVSARTDYALRVLVELAVRDEAVSGEELASAQGISPKYLASILADLRYGNFVTSKRGVRGGYRVKDPHNITVADVIRATSGPLVSIQGEWPEESDYHGATAELALVWIALRTAMRSVLESVTIADIAAKHLPDGVLSLTHDPAAWVTRGTRRNL